jgi:hypothetical protein
MNDMSPAPNDGGGLLLKNRPGKVKYGQVAEKIIHEELEMSDCRHSPLGTSA